MKRFFLIFALSVWQAFALPGAGLSYFPMSAGKVDLGSKETKQAQEGLARYKGYTDTLIQARCRKNTGTALDKNLAAAYESTCRASYQGAREEARNYFESEAKAELRLSSLTSQSTTMCGANRTDSGQRNCLDQVAAAYEEVARVKEGLAKSLLEAFNKASEWRNRNAEALKQYRKDKKSIEVIYAEATKKANDLIQEGQFMAANKVVLDVERAAKINTPLGVLDSTLAQSVTQSTISGYKQNIDSLMQEQEEAQSAASQFGRDAKDRAYALQEESMKYSDMAKEIRQRSAALPSVDTKPGSTDKSGISGSDNRAKLPDGRDVPVPSSRPEREVASTAKQSPNTGEVSNPGKVTPERESSVLPESGSASRQSNNPESGIANSAPPPTSASAPAPPAPTAAYPNISPTMPGRASPGGEYDHAGMPSYGATKEISSTTTNQLPVAQLGDEATETAAVEENFPETDTESDRTDHIPREVAAGDGISGDIRSGSAASTSAGVRGEGGSFGVSSASGGRLASEKRQKEIAGKEQFSPKLESGAVSIAGSDVKSAVTALAQELGALDLDLDLDLGGLTEEEKAALAPLDGASAGGGGGWVNGAGGRKIANASSTDQSIQEVDSLGLFERARSAHERAQKRGNLILGLKKKY